MPRKIGSNLGAQLTLAGTFKEAFEKIGGMPALIQWGQENPTEFFKIWAKVSAWEEDRAKVVQAAHPGLKILSSQQYLAMAERAKRLAIEIEKPIVKINKQGD